MLGTGYGASVQLRHMMSKVSPTHVVTPDVVGAGHLCEWGQVAWGCLLIIMGCSHGQRVVNLIRGVKEDFPQHTFVDTRWPSL